MVQFNWKGTWLPNLPYNENVVVEYDNVNYISNQFVPPTDITPFVDTLHWDEMLVLINTPTPTPSFTPTPSITSQETPTPTPTITSSLTPTPTFTPTPSTSPIPVTGYGYTLVVLDYNPPLSGNIIFPQFTVIGATSGTTNPNTFNTNGVYWNAIDNTSVDRTSYFSAITGNSITISFTQLGQTVIYSGMSGSFGTLLAPGGTQFYHDSNFSALTLIQSASTNFVTGQTVYIGYTTN